MSRFLVLAGAAAMVSACATVTPAPVTTAAPQPLAMINPPVQAGPVLRRKIAVGRFTNATNYGRSLLTPGARDPIADQAGDMLVNALTESGQFLVFERDEADLVLAEQAVAGAVSGLVGVDALVVGSVTQFGRRTEGQAGFLSSTRRQAVDATVEIRLVDVRTGQVFFTAMGAGTASTESGEVAGFGSRAAYDATLNDRAIAAAIADCINSVIQRLTQRRWSTDVLRVDGDMVFITGGPGQGVALDEEFIVEIAGETVTSGQSGLPVTLPGRETATIRVVSFFGDTPESEGAVARIVSGSVPTNIAGLRVVEARR